jgi:hypothetical protein
MVKRPESAGGQEAGGSNTACEAVDAAIKGLQDLFLPAHTDLQQIHTLLATTRPSLVNSISASTAIEDLEDAFDQAIVELQNYGRFLMLVGNMQIPVESVDKIVDAESVRREKAMESLVELRGKLRGN